MVIEVVEGAKQNNIIISNCLSYSNSTKVNAWVLLDQRSQTFFGSLAKML